MIALLMALAAAQPGPATDGADPAFRTCANLVKADAAKALTHATEWRVRGGGVLARQCLGLAYVELDRWAPAAAAFEGAAREAATARDPREADFWVQSGNAWLAAEQGAKAVTAFNAALATTGLTPELRGEVHLDRARARVALADPAAARIDLDKGLALVPADPFGWYLSSALAVREGQMARAAADIAKAVTLAPDDAGVLLQAGSVAAAGGDGKAAKDFYQRAAKRAPNSEAGRAASAALAAGERPEPVVAAED